MAGEVKSKGEDLQELRGVWISYLDWDKLPADQAGFQKGVDQILERCVELKMNAVFVHVRSDCDAMYPSAYFPWSRAHRERIRDMIRWHILWKQPTREDFSSMHGSILTG